MYSATISSRHEFKKQSLGFDEELSFQKMACAFFADRYRGADAKSLISFQWFAPSISAQIFRKYLKAFLETKKSKNLNESTLEQIKLYVNISEESSYSYYLIDLIRAEDIRNIFLTKKGYFLWIPFKRPFRATTEQISELVTVTVEKIKALKPGEWVFFLGGTVLHETQLAVQHVTNDGWEIYDCNSGRPETLIVYHPTEEEIKDVNFWQRHYEIKLKKEEDSSEHPIIWLKKCVTQKIKAARIKPQGSNTCHFKCQMALLKAFMVKQSNLKTDIGVLEWKTFKVLFGHFLLQQNKITNKRLLEISNECHEKRKHALGESSFFHECIQLSKYKETRDAYLSALDIIDYPTDFLNHTSQGSELKSLLILQLTLLNSLESIPVLFEQLKPLFDSIENRWVRHTLEVFRKNSETKLNLLENQLKTTLLHAANPNWLPGYEIAKQNGIKKINEFCARYLGINNSRPVEALTTPPVSLKTMHACLKRFAKEPLLLHDLQKKPLFRNLLIQGIQNGEIELIEKIIKGLNEKDKNHFYSGENLLLNLVFTLLPQSLEKYVIDNAESSITQLSTEDKDRVKLAHLLIYPLVRKAINENRFDALFMMQNIMNLKFVYSETILKKQACSIHEIERILIFLSKTDDIQQFALYPEILTFVVVSLLRNGDSNQFEQLASRYSLPIPEEKILPEFTLPILSYDQSVKWYSILNDEKKSYDNPLYLSLKSILIFSLYHTKANSELETLGTETLMSITPKNLKEFQYTEDDRWEGRKNYLASFKSESLRALIALDLIDLFTEENNKDAVYDIVKIVPEIIDKPNRFSQKTYIFIGKALQVQNDDAQPNLMERYFQPLSSLRTLETLEFTNEILEANSSFAPSLDLYSHSSIERYAHYHPTTILNYFIQKEKLLFLRTRLDKEWGTKSYSNTRRAFLKNWKECSAIFRTDEPLLLCQLFIDPLFKPMLTHNLELIIDIWEHLPPSILLRDAFALFFLQYGKEDLANWVYPNKNECSKLKKKFLEKSD